MKKVNIEFYTPSEDGDDWTEVWLVPNDLTIKKVQAQMDKDKEKSYADGGCYDNSEAQDTLLDLGCKPMPFDDSWVLEW